MYNEVMPEFGRENLMLLESSTTSPFLLKLEDSDSNELRIRIAAALAGQPGEGIDPDVDKMGIPGLRKMLEKSCPIYPDPQRRYEIWFPQYIMYQVRNESFTEWDDYEIRKGKTLQIFEQSRLLDQLQTVTFCFRRDDGTGYPGEWKHYRINTENNIIDIIAHVEPVIRALPPAQP